jgi:hypothetical protein
MYITNNIVFKQFYTPAAPPVGVAELVSQVGQKTILPDSRINYTQLNQELVQKIVSYREAAIKPLTDMLSKANDEKQITEGLYILDRMCDAGVKDIYKTYPVISRFNYTPSPNIQVMLAGIYRKTLVPDAFGPLLTMFWQNASNPKTIPFDPNEELGGAILEYLRNKTAVADYGKTAN